MECVRALISAASGGDRSSDWAAAPSAIAATDLAFNLALEAVRDATPNVADVIAVLRQLLQAMPPRALLDWAMGRRSDAQIQAEEAQLGPGHDLSLKAAISRQLAPPGTALHVRELCTERLRLRICGGDEGRGSLSGAYNELVRQSGAAGTPQQLQQVLAAAGELLLDTTPPPLLRAMLLAESNDPCMTPAVSSMSDFDAEEEALPSLPTHWAASGGGAERHVFDTTPATQRPLRALLDVLDMGPALVQACETSGGLPLVGFGPLHLVTLTLI